MIVHLRVRNLGLKLLNIALQLSESKFLFVKGDDNTYFPWKVVRVVRVEIKLDNGQ